MAANKSKAPVVVVRGGVSDLQRMLLRLVPASFASVAVHGVLLLLFFLLIPATQADVAPEEAASDSVLNANEADDAAKAQFLTTDIDRAALERRNDLNYPVDRSGEFSIPGPVDPGKPFGVPDDVTDRPPVSIPAPGGFGIGAGGPNDPFAGPGNTKANGDPGGYNESGRPLVPGGINGRSGASRDKALQSGGGTTASEAAVTAGLRWLARQQMPDGRWMLNSPNLPEKDRGAESNDVAATALGLLPLLGAGKTHKPGDKNEYDKVIEKGLKFLLRSQDQKTGYFGGSMYAHGLATIAICEAYGLTQDPVLRRPAQSALNLIVNTQHEEGGWRYGPSKQPGDLSISGWQIMALKSGQMAGLDVPAVATRKAAFFLDSLASEGDEGYGYVSKASTPRMTAVGLLCRQYMQNWGPAHPRMIKAIDNHLKKNPPNTQDVYYYYYATQVMHHFGGDAWRTWNETMREALIKKQEKKESTPNNGSWSPAGDPWGRAGGRLMMTSLNLLTLEVYYRYLPLYYRDAGYKKDEAGKKAP